MRADLRRAFEAEITRHEEACLTLAERRIDAFEREWKRTRKTPVTLCFGMGAFFVKGEGREFCQYTGNGWPKIIEALDADLDELTDQYRTACPNDRRIDPNEKHERTEPR